MGSDASAFQRDEFELAKPLFIWLSSSPLTCRAAKRLTQSSIGELAPIVFPRSCRTMAPNSEISAALNKIYMQLKAQ